MNYRHLYHAGSFSDVMKHMILIAVIEKMKEKPAAFSVLDAFAGIGIYDLGSEEAEKTGEYLSGVGVLPLSPSSHVTPASHDALPASHDVIPASHDVIPAKAGIQKNDKLDSRLRGDDNYFQTYTKIIEELNINSSTLLYPGSPYIISELLRPDDSLVACELHKEDYAILKKNICYPAHNIDAYNAIKAFLPPKTPRGLVLLDPAFEVKDEFSKVISALTLIRKRFSAGIVMVWYPIKERNIVQKFYTELKNTGYSEFLKIEFEIEHDTLAMNKCGVVIANPPNINDRLKVMMHFLCNTIYNEKAKSIVELI